MLRPAGQPPYKRWKIELSEILHWNRFDPAHLMSDDDIDRWIAEARHKVMFRSEEIVA